MIFTNPRLFSLVVAWCLSGCATSPTRHTASSTVENGEPADYQGPFIDAHVHFDGEQTGPSQAMLNELKKSNVVGAVVHASQKKSTPDIQTAHLPKLSVCAAIVPGKKISDVQRGIDEKRYHCMKIYLGYVPKAASDSFYKPFYKLAEKKKVPVVFHTGDTYDKMATIKFADPLSIDEVAIAYPKVKFVLAHMGNPWIQSAAEVVYKNDNCYVDLSALMIGDIERSTPEQLEELVIKPIHWFFLYVENPKKFLFGSDWPLVSIAPYLQIVKRAIPKEHWRAVFYQNAIDVFPDLKN